MLKSHNYVIQIEMEVIRLEKLETGFQKRCKKYMEVKDRQQRGQRWERERKRSGHGEPMSWESQKEYSAAWSSALACLRASRSTEEEGWLLFQRTSVPQNALLQSVFLSVSLGALSTAWDLICRSALCARERELPSTARRTSVSETSIFLVA